ncbi:MAG: TonB-system energizer ExbB [bacterium]|nr:TonB-system energizer ExbB [bacterium]
MQWMNDLVDFGMMGLLGALSFLALAVVVERWLVYRKLEPGAFKSRKQLELVLSTRLHLLATIGSNAPYLGLLGTVLGIMLTFYNLGQSGQMDSGKIMTGLALAMKVTALGLVVAIPTVTAYNLLQRRAKVLLMRWEIAQEA